MRTGRGTRCSRATMLAFAIAPLAATICNDAAYGQQLTWDASGNSPTAATDGSGTWSTTASNWTDGVANTPWINGDFAAIGNGGTAGTITVSDTSGSVSAAGILFNPVSSGSYTIAADTGNTLTLSSGASLNFAVGASATISAPIAGTVGMTVGGGILNLAGHNTFTGGAQFNSGTVIANTVDSFGDSGNLVSLGTPNTGTSLNDPVAALVLNSSVSMGSFRAATNNAAANAIAINSGATMNVTSNAPLSGTNASVNAAFIVGSSNLLANMTTLLTVTGQGTLAVSGGSSDSSFLVGIGNGNSKDNGIVSTLDLSSLSHFSFVTGTGVIPAAGGN